MLDFITLSCPSCGHKLQITDDIDRFACATCGNEYIVYRSGGVVTLKPVMDDATTPNDNFAHQLLTDLVSSLKDKTITPEQRNDLWNLLEKFKKEMEKISEAEAKQRKAEESTEED